MKKAIRILTVLVILCLVLPALSAQVIKINIATVAPEKSPYGDVLRRMAAEWSKMSGGKVEMKVFFGDKLGDEEDIVQKIRLNSLQGGMLTLSGLAYIEKPLMTIAAPLLIENDDQMRYVLKKMIPDINDRLKKQEIGRAHV